MQDQVETPVEETKEEDTVVTEEEQLEQVKALTEETQEETQEEPQEEIQDEVEETQEEPKAEVINDEMAEQFPALKMYLGKPLKDVAPAYQKLVRKLHDTIKENNDLKREKEKNSLNELGSPPDSIEDPKGFKEWMDKHDTIIKQQALSETQVKEKINPLAEVKKRLPEGTNIEKVANEWSKYNAPRLFNEVGELRPSVKELYEQNPEIMIDELVSFYRLLSKAEQNDLAIEKKSKEEAFKQTKQAFKKARETQKESSQVSVVKRTQETSEEQEILDKIYQLAQG